MREETELAKMLLDTPLRKVYTLILSMVGKDGWDQSFVLKCLEGFIECLKVIDSDYETIDLLTLEHMEKLHELTGNETRRGE